MTEDLLNTSIILDLVLARYPKFKNSNNLLIYWEKGNSLDMSLLLLSLLRHPMKNGISQLNFAAPGGENCGTCEFVEQPWGLARKKDFYFFAFLETKVRQQLPFSTFR